MRMHGTCAYLHRFLSLRVHANILAFTLSCIDIDGNIGMDVDIDRRERRYRNGYAHGTRAWTRTSTWTLMLAYM